jgi:hypothetical protein
MPLINPTDMNNVRLKYTGYTQKVRAAVEKANEILSSESFYSQIKSYPRFDQSALSPELISHLLQESDYEITVRVNWFFPAFSTRTFDRITVVRSEFSDNLPAAVNFLVFETVKSIDLLYNILQKEEGIHEHRSVGAPLVIGAIAEVMVS